ncbi:hypothetical protein [Pseudomonas sp. nanlin1]|uniref:hypothetical protein n=1 Tax=Pseudomonas sp. nanlin1 TaxID=3040605 RepID=UPI00388E7748
MNTLIEETQIDTADLRSATEIWLVKPGAVTAHENDGERRCLWRGGPVVSHDMLSEGTHAQNVQRFYLAVADLHNDQHVEGLIARVQLRLRQYGLEGEFLPSEQGAD